MKKKLFALMLALVCVFATACNGSVEDETKEAVVESTVEDEVVEEVVEEVTEETTEEVTEEVTEEATEEVTEEVVEETESVEVSYYPGVFTETGYESEYLGLRYTTPEGFTMATDEELAEYMEAGQELLSEDFNALQLKYAEMVTINELMVSDETGIVNFNITLEKTNADLAEYIELFKAQIAGLSGMTVEIVGEEEVEIAGATYTKILADVETQGVVLSQEYCLRKQDDRVVALIITWYSEMEDLKDTMMSGFAAY